MIGFQDGLTSWVLSAFCGLVPAVAVSSGLNNGFDVQETAVALALTSTYEAQHQHAPSTTVC